MIDPKALETLFRYTIGDFKRNKEAEEAMTYGRSKELIGDNVTELGKVETKLTDDQKRFIGQEKDKSDIESIRVNLVEDPEKKTGLASLNKKSDDIIQYESGLMYNPKTEKYDTADPIASAIMFAESSGVHEKGDKLTTSKDNAIGLMQLVPKAFADKDKPAGYGVNYKMTLDDIKDPEKNYKAGRDYIYGLIDYWKNEGYPNEDAFDLAVMSYNAGVPKVTRYLNQITRKGKPSKIVMEDDTQTYLNNVYKALGGKSKKIKKPEEYKDIANIKQAEEMIKEREEFLKQEKQSGGRIESDPYKSQPRFI